MLPGARMVGPALTVRNIMQSTPPTLGAMARKSGQADIEAHNLAQPGDVLVIEGVAGISSLGGNSASVGKRQGEAGAIVDGATRDVATARAIGHLIRARREPITGKWRSAVAINGWCRSAACRSVPATMVADDNGGFIPRARTATCVRAGRIGGEESAPRRCRGSSAVELANKAYFRKIDPSASALQRRVRARVGASKGAGRLQPRIRRHLLALDGEHAPDFLGCGRRRPGGCAPCIPRWSLPRSPSVSGNACCVCTR
jgi:regulator of RNase E activity RraA